MIKESSNHSVCVNVSISKLSKQQQLAAVWAPEKKSKNEYNIGGKKGICGAGAEQVVQSKQVQSKRREGTEQVQTSMCRHKQVQS
jgi:hypothetical protein